MKKSPVSFGLIQSSAILVVIIMLFAGCTNPAGDDETIMVTGVTLYQNNLNMTEGGEDINLYAVVLPINASNRAVTWGSSNKGVATVVDGMVSPVSSGTAEITVTTEDGGFTAKCTVAVIPDTEPVTGVTLDRDTLSLTVGDAGEKLTATVSPDDATNKAVAWDSSDNGVAAVNSGMVTAVGQGTAVITVITLSGGFTAKCTVTVIAKTVPVTGVSLDKNTLSIAVGDAAEKLTATVSPADATNKDVVWGSSDNGVATVDNGMVTAVSSGTADITVSAAGGLFKATCKVTVVPKTVPVSGVSLDKNTLSLIEGNAAEKLTATVSPADATNKTLIWGSSDPNIATVVDGMVSPLSPGTADITVTAAGGLFKATCAVTVIAKTIPVTGVTLDRNTLELIMGGAAEILTATVGPADATNKAVTWNSSNISVATVNNGTVTAVGPGTSDIKVTTADGSFTATCKVTVVKNIGFGISFVWESGGIELEAEISESSLLVSENPLIVKKGAVVKITAPDSFSTYEWRIGMEIISTGKTCLFNAGTASAKPYVINLLVGNPVKGTSIEIVVQE